MGPRFKSGRRLSNEVRETPPAGRGRETGVSRGGRQALLRRWKTVGFQGRWWLRHIIVSRDICLSRGTGVPRGGRFGKTVGFPGVRVAAQKNNYLHISTGARYFLWCSFGGLEPMATTRVFLHYMRPCGRKRASSNALRTRVPSIRFSWSRQSLRSLRRRRDRRLQGKRVLDASSRPRHGR